MKILGICFALVISSLLLQGQATQTHLIVRDTVGNPILGATITYYDVDEKVIITDASYLDGHAFVDRNFKFLTVWRIGYKISKLNKIDITSDTTIVTLKNVRYDCPKFILMRNGKIKLDVDNYTSEIADSKLNYDEDCSMDTVFDRHGSIQVEICDTIKVAYNCKLAIPINGYVDYSKRVNNLFKKVEESKLLTSNVANVDFAVGKDGRMKIEKVSGINPEFRQAVLRAFENLWIPADMWGRKVETNYRITIQIE